MSTTSGDPSRGTDVAEPNTDPSTDPSAGHACHHHHGPTSEATAPPTAPAPAGTTYTCPMHPEIRQDGPGPCPICGMALEPVTVTAEATPNEELVDLSRRLRLSVVPAAVVLVLGMVGPMASPVLVADHDLVAPAVLAWVQLALATPVVLWAGWPFLVRGWTSVRRRSLNMFTLIALGTSVAWLYSVVATVAPQVFPPSFRTDGRVDVYFEAAAVITVLVLVGQVLELRAREQTSGALRELLALAPRTARRLDADGSEHDVTEHDVAVEEVRPGDRLRIRPGEKVPVDGVVLDGRSALDESLVTGESLPVEKTIDDAVVAGTLNTTGSLVMRADKVGSDTLLARIVTMVGEAQRSRAPIQRLADRVAAIFVPAVILVAVAAFFVWALVGPEPRLPHALVAAVAVLIIACPCALGLATPMSIMVGVGQGARLGVLVKNAEALERMEKIDTLVIDKTGTLTEGRPSVTELVAVADHPTDELLRLTAAVEQASEHPLAAAVVAAARARGLSLPTVTDFDAPAGRGATGIVDGRRVTVGRPEYLQDEGIELDRRSDQDVERLRRSGGTVVFVGIDGRLAGLVALADRIRESTPEALQSLRAEGIEVVMLTGDHEVTARAVADQLSITRVEAGVLPDRKSDVVQQLRDQGRVVAMAGDGVNDAPALAAADVGLAMGSGTDVAIESAGVTLLNGDVRGIVRTRRLSRATMVNIRQNLVLAFVYNSVGIPIAAGVLYPATGLLLSPMISAAAMALSSVSVIGNALRLRRRHV